MGPGAGIEPTSEEPQSPMLPLHHPGHGLSPPGGRNHAEWICLISLFMARYGSPQLAMLNSWYWIVVQQAIRNLCDWKLPLRAPSNLPKSQSFLCRFRQLNTLAKQCTYALFIPFQFILPGRNTASCILTSVLVVNTLPVYSSS